MLRRGAYGAACLLILVALSRVVVNEADYGNRWDLYQPVCRTCTDIEQKPDMSHPDPED
jgi:hypothetical protein